MASLMTPRKALEDLVQRYKVCWEVWPEYSAMGNGIRQIGFELELLGSPAVGTNCDPCCAESAAIHAALKAIARWILEQDDSVRVQIDDSSQSLCYSPVRGDRADVTLSIKILHQVGFENPIDEEERDFLEKTKIRLRELGACEHQWHATIAPNNRVLAVA
jgi:hypothetical protein